MKPRVKGEQFYFSFILFSGIIIIIMRIRLSWRLQVEVVIIITSLAEIITAGEIEENNEILIFHLEKIMDSIRHDMGL